MADKSYIIVFDGVCVLCNRSVDFIIKRDPQKKFRFIAAQSPFLNQYITEEACLKKIKDNETIVLIAGNSCYFQSEAALLILSQLQTFWKLLIITRIIPKRIRNAIYTFIAKRRYRWMGKLDNCPLPAPDQSDRFL